MKSKFFTLFAAIVLLFSAQASAQANGDVNEDGKVNEQDITAILEIMAEAGGVKEQTKYYWYCGQTKPTSMANNPTQDEITDGTSDTDFKPNTWHPLTKDATSIAHTIVGGTSGNAWYIAVPTSFGFKPTATDLVTPNNSWTTDGTITVGNVEYTLWKPAGTSARQAVYMAKEQTKYYWYVGNGGELTDPNHPMNNGIATNIDKINLTFELDKSNSLLQTATSYNDLVGKEFPFPNHFIIPTEWLDKIQIVNANNFPWAWGTTVIDSTNKYTWCWNSGTGTGTFKIIAK